MKQRTNEPFEVLVVDNDPDASASNAIDRIVADANSPRLLLYRNEQNIGMFGNWNRCIQLARGRWITILNDDDLLDADFLSACLSSITKRPDVRLIACAVRIVREHGMSFPPKPLIRRLGRAIGRWMEQRSDRPIALRLEDYFLSNPHFGSLGVLMERDAALNLGGFSPALFPSADYAFFTRHQIAHGGFCLKHHLATYRIGVNESLKPEVLRGWLRQGLELRRELAQRIGYFPRLLEFYGRIQAVDSVKAYGLLWGAQFDSKALLKDAGLPSMPTYVLKHVLGSLLRVVFCLIRCLNGRASSQKVVSDKARRYSDTKSR